MCMLSVTFSFLCLFFFIDFWFALDVYTWLIVLREGDKCVFIHSEEQTLQVCIWRMGNMEMLEKFEKLQQATCQCVLLKWLNYSLKKKKITVPSSALIMLFQQRVLRLFGIIHSCFNSSSDYEEDPWSGRKEELNTSPPFAFPLFFHLFMPLKQGSGEGAAPRSRQHHTCPWWGIPMCRGSPCSKEAEVSLLCTASAAQGKSLGEGN